MLNEIQRQVSGNLLRAAQNDQLIVLECKRVRDGKIVAVFCGCCHDGESYVIFPYAELIDPANGEPTEQYYPPDEKDPEKFKGKMEDKWTSFETTSRATARSRIRKKD